MIPESLVQDIINGDVVLFLGAGASTEGVKFFDQNLTDILSQKCNYPKKKPRSLPEISSYYCEKLDNGFKGRLVREIRHYLDKYLENNDAYRIVTRNYKLISKIGFFQYIITTNWDVFLERELNLIPFVRDKDLVYWKDNKRQLIKMHGCISQPDTMIITVDDYNDFTEDRINGPISTKIKDFMTTKSILFVGYSLKDENFRLIHDKILSKMGDFSRTSYAVMRNPTNEEQTYWSKKGITLLPYNAFSFFLDLYHRFISKEYYFLPHHIDLIHNKRHLVTIEHHKIEKQEGDLYSINKKYQNGIIDSLDRIIIDVNQGKTKQYIRNLIKQEQNILDSWIKKYNPLNISYYTGRLEALNWIFNTNSHLNLYINLDFNPINNNDFIKLCTQYE